MLLQTLQILYTFNLKTLCLNQSIQLENVINVKVTGPTAIRSENVLSVSTGFVLSIFMAERSTKQCLSQRKAGVFVRNVLKTMVTIYLNNWYNVQCETEETIQ